MRNKELEDFLKYNAQNGYANPDSVKLAESDGSTTIKVVQGDWLARDNYFTSEDGRRYNGSMVVFLGGKATWFCGYSGRVSEQADPGEVYTFLKEALLLPEAGFPVRGPWLMQDVDFLYMFMLTDSRSTLDQFETLETIHKGKTVVYEGTFIGGMID